MVAAQTTTGAAAQVDAERDATGLAAIKGRLCRILEVRKVVFWRRLYHCETHAGDR